MKFSPQQEAAIKAVDKWFYQDSKKQQVFRVFGFAGTGKTTLAVHFSNNIQGETCFAAYTGKAALMMQRKGCRNARTIHSLIYKPVVHKDGTVEFELNPMSDVRDCSIVIIDECSMVDEPLAKHLLGFGKPILVLGDPAQLPPIEGAGYFTECEPDVMLTEIHRQARDNPIIRLATEVRLGNQLTLGTYGESRVVTKISSQDAKDADQILVGRNATRTNLNSRMRKILGYDSELPIVGERLICLRNDTPLNIQNGGMFTVSRVIEKNFPTAFLYMSLIRDDDPSVPAIVKVHKSFFSGDTPKPDWRILKGSQEFDWAYAITCHKAQGSQWNTGIIYDESWCFREHNLRWLYTSITRFSERITVVKE